MPRRDFRCSDCHQHKPVADSGVAGYAVLKDGRKICYDCCAVRDTATLLSDGHSRGLPLYLVGPPERLEVVNWPGTLRFRVRASSAGAHNLANSRTDVWFRGPAGEEWYGVQYGRDSQICHCRRLVGKRRSQR